MAGRRLKVFQAQFGFYDTVVAAPSQAAALKAWGTHQNLFASGDAKLITDEAAVAAALRHPEVPLRRALGSSDPFALKPKALPKIPVGPKRPAAVGEARPAPKPAEPPPDRTRLDAAEAELAKLNDARKREEAELRRRQDQLDADRTAAQDAYVKARKQAARQVAEARDAYRRAGGSVKP